MKVKGARRQPNGLILLQGDDYLTVAKNVHDRQLTIWLGSEGFK